jgi:hypothetical protein
MLVQLDLAQLGETNDICDTISIIINSLPNYLYNSDKLIVSLMSLSAILCKEKKIDAESYQEAAFTISEAILTPA